ncbi:MAG: hypothetical protein LBQ84_00750 [Flavobacteriaceae bacterium]|jgi:hypothetical protein|nr:hypothetical protein [Flavobacteriaceae bacterium]
MEQKKINVKRATTDIWLKENPILEKNSMGVEILLPSKLLKIKLGDGITNWVSLPYFIDAELSELRANEIIDNFQVENGTFIPVADRFAMFDRNKGLKSSKTPVDDDDVVRLADVATAIDATDVPTPDKVAKYNDDAGLKSDKVPSENNDVIRLTEFENHTTSDYAHNATSTPTANKIAMYNENSGLKSGKVAIENNDVVRFLEYDNSVADINTKLATLNGAYIPLDPYNFGKTLVETDPDDIIILNTYAIANTPNATSMDDVLNDTVIINLFDNYEYVYNKDQGIWANYKNGFLTIATNNHLGVVKGTEPPADPSDDSKNTFIQILSNGSMKTIGEAGKIDTVNLRNPDNDKNVNTHITMTQAEYDAITDKNTLNGLQITLTDVEYPDGGLMMVPDYANQETINRISTVSGTWTVDRVGFINARFDQGNASWRIDGKDLGNNHSEPNKIFIPVMPKNVVSMSVNSGSPTNIYCFFIPPKLVQKLPPIIVEGNGSYSYDEIETNETWVDGSTIYKKTFYRSNNLPASTTENIAHGITNLGIIIDAKLVFRTSNNTSWGIGPEKYIGIYVDSTNIAINLSSTYTTPSPHYVTIWYTKL